MEYSEHVVAVRREAAAAVTALRAGSLDVTTPTCPDWTLVDLARHLRQFAGFWVHALQGGGQPPTREDLDDGSLTDAAMVGLFEANAAEMVALLEARGPEDEVWTWVEDDHTARFVARRSAHELAIHRYDAQMARGVPQPIESALAADGIEEIFVMAGAHGGGTEGSGQTMHLHGTDREGDEWMVAIEPEGLVVTHEHGKGDLAVRGAVGDLELVLYARPPVGEVEMFGDQAVLDVWRSAFTFG